MSEKKNIGIIGAGVAGLVAALELERQGLQPTILEATDRVGGRVKTDYIDGFQFDHGFQVLLTAYPEVKRYLDVDALDHRTFRSGAMIYSGHSSFLFADPLREPATLLRAFTSQAGKLTDKWKLWRLSENLKNKSIDSLFESESISTMAFLRNYGFSDAIIRNFFKPFFSGIFLENELETSARMFQFIFKMFSEGHAAIPEKGMQAIPEQLLSQLKNSTVHYNAPVTSIDNTKVASGLGNFDFEALIVATDPSSLLSKDANVIEYQSTVNLYFSIAEENHQGYIGLQTSPSSIINNISFMTDVASSYAPKGQSLISVSVVGTPKKLGKELRDVVLKELGVMLNKTEDEITFLKSYHIKKALPKLSDPTMKPETMDLSYGDHVILAGDHLLGGSLNAAMASGRYAVDTLLKNL